MKCLPFAPHVPTFMDGPPTDHEPVMTKQVLSYLLPSRGRDYVDATVGSGGHAEAIMQASQPDGRVLGLDADPTAIARAASRLEPFGNRVTLKTANFAAMSDVARAAGFSNASGVLMDLGFSSTQIDDPRRGFSFQTKGPLDMRFDQQSGLPARDVIARMNEKELADVIYQFGDERKSRRIARYIVQRREKAPFETTTDLAETVARAIRPNRGRIHPATRTFQALRLYVNHELENIPLGLEAALEILVAGGRLVVLSFHSLEDRIVKNFIRDRHREGTLRALTPKPLRPDEDECRSNPRSRSARFRAAEIVG